MEEEHGECRHVDIAGLKAHVLRQDVMLIEQEPVASRDGLGQRRCAAGEGQERGVVVRAHGSCSAPK